MIEEFQEAQAAVMEKATLKGLEERAYQLTDHALFPIRDCFYFYSDEEREMKREPIVSPDQAGILQIINDLFLREPERFGDEVTRMHLKQQITKMFKAYEDKRAVIQKNLYSDGFNRLREEKREMVANLFGKIGDLFTQHCPDALKGISIAVVGFDAPNWLETYVANHRQAFSASAQRLLNQFDRVYDFFPTRPEGSFTLEAVDTKYTDTKVDYVVTGNVLNDPTHSLSSHHVFLAAARMLKQGGRALHLLGYSNHYYDLHINNPAMVLLAGQKRIASLPTQHHFNGLEETRYGCQDFVMFEQTRAVNITPRMVERIIEEGISTRRENSGGTPFIVPYINPEAPQLPVYLAKLASLASGAQRGELRLETLR